VSEKYIQQFKAYLITSRYDIHPQQIKVWKKKSLENMCLFLRKRPVRGARKSSDKTYKKIKQLKVEKNF